MQPLILLKNEDIIIKNEVDDDDDIKGLHENPDKLTNKIGQARNLLKESINLCQQVFLKTDDSEKSIQFDNVVEPLVTALDLLTNSLKTIGDIYQLEDKHADASYKDDNFVNCEDYESDDSNEETIKDPIKIKKETRGRKRKNSRINYDEDYEPKKVAKKENPTVTKKKGEITEYECDKCEFKTKYKALHNSHVQGLNTIRKCPWCPDKIKTGEEKLHRGRKSAEKHFQDHMTEKHPELCTDSTTDSTTPTKQYICKQCGQQLNGFADYDEHLTQQHNLGYNFHCKYNCGFTSTILKVIKNHLKEVHTVFLECTMCPNKYPKESQLNAHFEEFHTRVNCDLCKEEFESKKLLNHHVKQEHPDQLSEDMISCSICGEAKTKKYLSKHMEAVHGNKDVLEIIKCNECDYTTSRSVNLYKHKRMHHAEDTFLCDLCPFVGTKLSLQNHKQKHLEKTLCCKLCDFATAFNYVLKKHMLVKHTPGYSEFNCDKCFKTLKSKAVLIWHMKKHDESNKMQCTEPDCSYETFYQENLQRHIDKVHKSIRYPCTKCDYVGSYKRDINLHIRTVHEGNYHNCSECDFRHAKKFKLMEHIRKVHEGKTWPCSDCDFVSNTRGTLNHHIRAVHKGIQYTCDLCNYKTPHKRNLARHKELIHKIFETKDNILQPEIKQQQ